MDFLRGRLLRRSPATWSKEGDGGRGSFSATESSSRRGSSTSSWLRERTSGTSWGKEGTSVSSWRDGSSVCPPYTSKSSYSKSEQSWRLPRLRINLFNEDLIIPSKVLTVTMEIISSYHKVADAYKVTFGQILIFNVGQLNFQFSRLFRRDSYTFQSPTPTR